MLEMITKIHSFFTSEFHKVFSHLNSPQNIFCVSFCTSSFCQRQFRSPIKYTKLRNTALKEKETKIDEDADRCRSDSNRSEADVDQLDTDSNIVLDRSFLNAGSGHQVLVIQPFIKWGRGKKTNTTPDLQLLESVTLIKTLRNWKVVEQLKIPLMSFNRIKFFGKGNLNFLQQKIKNSSVISAVFISVKTLTFKQQVALQNIFQVPVFDRYTIIMHILKKHAQTKEAKLQIQKAQLPYILSVLKGFNFGFNVKLGVTQNYLGGEKSSWADRIKVFKKEQAKLNKEIFELRERRQMVRKKRGETEIPTVAVLGYTNAGKTSLIKALTGKESLNPQDYLFATLDVTSHLGQLPSGLNVYYIDTLGFINDLPTYLIESFVATLEDATSADVIIHVRDLSHPDTISQNDNVMKTLQDLKLPEESMKNIITVGNKIDLIKNDNIEENTDLILVSSTLGTGISILREEIEKRVLLQSNKIKIVIRVESGSEEYEWIHEHSNVYEESADVKNNQFTFLKVIISPSVLARFKHKFIKNHRLR